ncbi:hypothetical protein HDU79_011691 [Rhizoclosmatium sp. JEL0117]|nr:hypothetical protein HDU79_011691 [Rhizoclosmatium sp. JEL0117]
MSQSIKTVAANSHLFHLLPTFYTICINQYPQETWSTDPPLFLHQNIPLLAAKAGNLHALEFLHTLQNVPFSPSVMDTAASNGHYDIVRFLQSNRNREGCTTDAMDGASRIGDLRILRLLDEERSEGCTSYAMLWAIQSGRLDVVKFLVGTRNMSEELTGRPNREGVIANWCVGDAASRGHLNVVRYLCEKGLGSPGESGLQEAAQAGHVHVVEYLMETGFGGSIRDADLVALSGSYETFRFLHEEEKLSLTDTMLTSILQQSSICMKEVTDKSRELAGLIEILDYVMSQGALALESDKCNAQKLPNTSDKHRILSILNMQ